MPLIGLLALLGAVFRSLIVAIAHVTILFIVCFTTPLWMIAVLRPSTHGDLGLKVLGEFRTWSREVVGAAGGIHQR